MSIGRPVLSNIQWRRTHGATDTHLKTISPTGDNKNLLIVPGTGFDGLCDFDNFCFYSILMFFPFLWLAITALPIFSISNDFIYSERALTLKTDLVAASLYMPLCASIHLVSSQNSCTSTILLFLLFNFYFPICSTIRVR